MEAIAAREEAGETLWAETIPYSARVKVAHVWEAVRTQTSYEGQKAFDQEIVSLFRVAGMRNPVLTPATFETNVTDTDMVLNYVEAVWSAANRYTSRAQTFEQVVNKIFNDHRIAFRMVDGKVIPLSSDELHVEVVRPTLRLLVDRRFNDAHEAYLKALKEISANDPADAITDAATALQIVLTHLGCQGNALGPLVKDARKRSILAAHDERLTEGLEKFLHWASADRSEMGDGHKVTHATNADAWLMVHIVGAIIVRLAGPTTRGSDGE